MRQYWQKRICRSRNLRGWSASRCWSLCSFSWDVLFVDLANHLRKSDLKDWLFALRPCAAERRGCRFLRVWIVELCSCWSATGTGTTLRLIYFVFWMEVWKEWLLTGITCGFYACLTVNCVRLLCGGEVPGKVTSYTARHTWATAGKYCHVPIEIISEGLGHASVTTTEGYMKGFWK